MRRRAWGTFAAVLLVLAACSGDDTTTPSTTTTTTSAAPDRFARGRPDGVFTIGVLLPVTGPGGTLGEPLVELVRAAVTAINAAGGIAGHDVEVVVSDEGASAATNTEELLGRESAIDALIGPASSLVALEVLPTIVDAGVVACSPTATSIGLTDLPDDGLFFRTIPSDALQAAALAQAIDGTGRGSASLVYTDDTYGRPFADALFQALARRGVDVINQVPYNPADDDLTDEAAMVLQGSPPVIAVVGDMTSGGRMVTEVAEESGEDGPLILANDAVRRADFSAFISRLGAAALTQRVHGVSVAAFDGESALESWYGRQDLAAVPFASATADCVNLLALGATVAGPDDPQAIASQVIDLSVGGQICRSFEECKAQIDQGLKIDYNGASGYLALDSNGDVTTAGFELYGFDGTGADKTESHITVP